MPVDPRPALRAFLAELAPGATFSDDDDLVKSGILPSMLLLELIDFVTERFAVTVTADDVSRGRFATVAALGRFIQGTP